MLTVALTRRLRGPQYPHVKTLIAAYAVIAVFIVAERRLRRGDEARTMEEHRPRGTTRQVGAAFGFALTAGLAAPLLSRIGIGGLPNCLAKVGLCFMVAGLGLRVWSAQTLGRFYTRTLRVAERSAGGQGRSVPLGPPPWLRRRSRHVARLRPGQPQCAGRRQHRPGDAHCLYAPHRRRGSHARRSISARLSGLHARTSRLLPRVYEGDRCQTRVSIPLLEAAATWILSRRGQTCGLGDEPWRAGDDNGADVGDLDGSWACNGEPLESAFVCLLGGS